MTAPSLPASRPTIDPENPPTGAWREIAAASVGNALEFYDLLVYGYFAITIGRQFFPTGDDHTSLLLSVGTFGISFVMRPLGAVVLGAYADRAGRKRALTSSILLMMVGTAMIAFAPTYARIGLWSPALVILARLVQGFSTGGEFGAATAFMVEHAPASRRGFYASWQASTQGLATVMAAGLSALITAWLAPAEVDAWGWRIAFMFGLLIGPVGFYIRKHVAETPEFLAAVRGAKTVVSPLRDVVSGNRAALLLGGGVVAGITGFNYVQKLYMPTFAVKQLHIAASSALACAVITGLMLMVFSPLFGAFSDRLGRRRFMLVSLGLVALSTYPLFAALVAYPTVGTLLLVQAIVGVLLAGILAPMPALLAELFPIGTRGSGLAISYNVSVTLFGGFAPLIVTWLIGTTGNKMSPSFYVLGTALVSLAALWSLRGPTRSDRGGESAVQGGGEQLVAPARQG
jgi:MHS family proline/betaine transporter-like MFS transporter